MNIELNKLLDWFNANKLSINVKKTHFMIFGKNNRLPIHQIDIMIDNCKVERV
jgi:hypothetical protein